MSESNTELKNILEAALLVAGRPLTVDNLLALFPVDSQPSREEIKDAITGLVEDYDDRGIELKQIGKGWRFHSRDKYADWLGRLTQEKPPRYSRAALETLAIIAYRQPVTRGDIEEIRGVTVSTEIIRTLMEREWIRQVGQRDVPGKPALYGTTNDFLEYFNLKSLNELPTLDELRDLEEISRELNLPLEFGDSAEPVAETTGHTETEESDETTATGQDQDEDDDSSGSLHAAIKAEALEEEEQAETALSAASSSDQSS
ncbi:MAG: SMC-Scp complex subunit ScpB [Gammaproteobacteria bacterium]|nr:SMC-Scp complex subunit ScpB [Gammaproteobacteria bacterium]